MERSRRAERIERIQLLINRKATGSPMALASRLRVSEATIYRDIQLIRSRGIALRYCKIRQTYYYEHVFSEHENKTEHQLIHLEAMKTAGPLNAASKDFY
ncbi:MAG: HTH domain-containing protein [Saprospiraceae bacterium]|nr:HTH domain-containing protein [Saprospiraceae bacterium]